MQLPGLLTYHARHTKWYTAFGTECSAPRRVQARAGYADITATGVAVVNSTKITCSLNLSGKKTGLWDVVVTNSDARSGTLTRGFGIGVPGGASSAGTSIRGLLDPVMSTASLSRQVRIWGVAQLIDSSTFWLDDGSGTRIMVFAPGYSGIANGDYASAIGSADVSANPPVLVTSTAPAKHN